MRRLMILSVVLIALAAVGLTVAGLNASATELRAGAGQAAVYPDQRDAVTQAGYWLVRNHQNSDGGYTSFSSGKDQAPSSVGGTLDATLALGGAGMPVAKLFPGKTATPLDFLAGQPDVLAAHAATDGSQAGKLVLALSTANEDPRAFAGHNFVISVTMHLSSSGAFGVSDAYKQSLAILALASAREPVPASSVDWLVDLQAANGSWDDGFGTLDNTDATAMTIMALLAADVDAADETIVNAVDFLAQVQLDDGSWEYAPGFGSSPNSTALVAQALSALGEDWYSGQGPWSAGGTSPLDALLANQSQSGAFQSDFGQGPFDDFYTTVQMMPAVAGRSFPFPSRFTAAKTGLACLADLQDESGGWEQFAGGGVDAGGAARAIQAIASAGGDPQDSAWTPVGGVNAVAALEAATGDYLANGRGGRVGVVLQGVAAAGPPYDVSDFAGQNLVLMMSDYLSPTGEYDSTAFGIYSHSEAMLGLLSADASVPQPAVDALLAAQSDGDWGDGDQNGIALQVLGTLDVAYPRQTLDVLQTTQLAGGGWGFGASPSASTSSEVAQGLVAVSQNPFGPRWSKVVDGTLQHAADVAMNLQEENGCWENGFAPGDDPYTTTDAIILLSLEPGWGFNQISLPVIRAGQ